MLPLRSFCAALLRLLARRHRSLLALGVFAVVYFHLVGRMVRTGSNSEEAGFVDLVRPFCTGASNLNNRESRKFIDKF